MSGSGGEPCASVAGGGRRADAAQEVLFPGCGGSGVHGVGYEVLAKAITMITDGGGKEISYELRPCFLADGVEGFGNIIAYRQILQRSRGAGHRRVKGAAPEIALRAIYADRRNPGDGLGEFKSMGAFERGWGCGRNSPEIIIKSICRIYIYGA